MTLPQILERLDELEKVCEGATREPWVKKWANANFTTLHWVLSKNTSEMLIQKNGTLFEADADFIAQSRTALPAAIKALRVVLYELQKSVRMDGDKSNGLRASLALTEIAAILEGM